MIDLLLLVIAIAALAAAWGLRGCSYGGHTWGPWSPLSSILDTRTCTSCGRRQTEFT